MSLSISPPLVLVIFCVFLNHNPFLAFSTNLPAPYSCYPVDTNPVHYRCFDNILQVEIPAFSLPQIRSYSPPRTRTWVLAFGRINTIATVIIIFITLLNVIVYKLRQHQELNSGEKLTLSSSLPSEQLCRRFSLSEILSATHNFDESLVIGQGGFGKVYKGVVDNGTNTVAIKRLSLLSKQGAGEFWTEITMLSKFRHSHLVSLLGYCDYSEMILVYEYMDNGTLADHLYKLAKKGVPYSPLYWIQRLQICIGAARGLDYLHTGTGIRQRVIHRDVKSTNILLDENWAAKISDFGMSKISPANQTFTHISTLVKGTFGYVDPEYFLTRRLTRKSDVYSFGVVLLEVLCGRPAVDSSLREDQRGLARWAQNCIKEGKVDYIVDPPIRVLIQSNCLSAFVQIAEQCLDPLPKKRPTMAEVVAWLEFALSLQEKGESDSSLLNDSFFKTFDTITEIQENEGSSANKEIVSGDNGGNDDDDGDNGSGVQAPVKPTFEGGKSKTEFAVTNPVKKASSANKVKLVFVSVWRVLSEKVKGLENCCKKTESDIPSNTSFFSKAGIHSNASADRNSKNEVVQLVPPSRNQLIPKLPSGPRAEKSDHRRSKNSGKSILDHKDEVYHQSSSQIVDAKLKMFSFAELKIATRNFRAETVLGEGGFGRVYRGWVNENTLEPTKPGVGVPVAIKKFNPDGLQGFEEWLAEVNFLGRCIHPNLVKLLGYCHDKENRELLIVYEFMSKGSLDTYIFRKHKELLSWTTRLKIATGAAKGLAFLHSLEKPVIYRDFKSSNILLDDDFNPKLSDFGLAKAGPEGDRTHVSTRIMGTYGYAAPEYVATGYLYVKSDVYSFGVVLLEMLTGLRALDVNRTTGQHNLIEYALPLLKNKRKLRSLVDSRLELNFPLDSAFGLAKLVALCLEVNPKDRPSMTEVVKILEQLLQK